MKTLRMLLAVVLLVVSALNTRSVLSAGFYLTGAQIYHAQANGNNVDSYRYTTNSTDINAPQPAYSLEIRDSLTGTRQDEAITFTLVTGVNEFQFDHAPNQTGPGPSFFGLNLFFSDSAASYNPSGGSPIAGHLTAVVQVNAGGVFNMVAANPQIQIQSYNYGAGNASANGLGSFSVGEYTVSLTSLSATNISGPTGSFGLTVSKLQITAVPEPATLGLGGLACMGLIGVGRRWLRRQT